MNERDKHLSLAIDSMMQAYEIAKQDEFLYRYMDLTGVIPALRDALKHCEDAADMPKPSRFKIIRRFWREAA